MRPIGFLRTGRQRRDPLNVHARARLVLLLGAGSCPAALGQAPYYSTYSSPGSTDVPTITQAAPVYFTNQVTSSAGGVTVTRTYNLIARQRLASSLASADTIIQTGLSANGGTAHAHAYARANDFVISGPASPTTVTATVHFLARVRVRSEGGYAGNNGQGTTVGIDLALNATPLNGSYFLGNATSGGSGAFASQTGSEFSLPINLTGSFPVNTPLQLRVHTNSWGNCYGNSSVSPAHVSGFVELQLNPAGPVITLPAGYTANSPSWNIVGGILCPSIIDQPVSVSVCPTGSASFRVSADGAAPISYRWQAADAGAPSGWIDLSDGPVIIGGRVVGIAAGTATDRFDFTASTLTPLSFRAAATNSCASPAFSDAATLDICTANCDCSTSSPLLTPNDFTCFVNRFVAGDSLANCDQSTSLPILTANDFTCFLNAFVSGCS